MTATMQDRIQEARLWAHHAFQFLGKQQTDVAAVRAAIRDLAVDRYDTDADDVRVKVAVGEAAGLAWAQKIAEAGQQQ